MFRKTVSTFRLHPILNSSLRPFASKSGELPPQGLNNCDIPIVDYDDPDHLPLPMYPAKVNEPFKQKKQRLLYQSRKRGMLENDLILSTFAAKYLDSFDEKQATMYDKLINGVTNDWDIYYWVTGVKPIPDLYNNEIMDLLKTHVKNAEKEKRTRQPDL